jgi:hypothetical protein
MARARSISGSAVHRIWKWWSKLCFAFQRQCPARSVSQRSEKAARGKIIGFNDGLRRSHGQTPTNPARPRDRSRSTLHHTKYTSEIVSRRVARHVVRANTDD